MVPHDSKSDLPLEPNIIWTQNDQFMMNFVKHLILKIKESLSVLLHPLPKGIALYHRGFKLNGYTQHSSSKQHLNGGLRVSNSNGSTGKNGKNHGNDHRIILNPFKWSLNNKRNSTVVNGNGITESATQKNSGNGGVSFYAHHPRYYHQHQIHPHVQSHQAQQKPACRML